MSKAIPPVQKYMTVVPFVIEATKTLTEIHDLMRNKEIRHVPVCEGSRVVGVLSDGDMYRAEAIRGGDPSKLTAANIMKEKPYTVTPNSPLDEVVAEMARQKMGSAVVVDNGKVVGVFTATDALHAFAELLNTRLRH